MPLASDFGDAFTQAYEKARQRFTDQEWSETWCADTRYEHPNWNDFMLYGEPNQPDSVLTLTARLLSLQHWAIDPTRPWGAEPFHLDAVFVPQGANHWFPVGVAIEHENETTGFRTELHRLLSVRAPLKVGITYAFGPNDGEEIALTNRHSQRVFNEIRSQFASINAVIGEDGASEYLFLLGWYVKPFQVQWRSLTFCAAIGPGGQTFAPF